jgi:hypothetical protein
MEKLFSENQFNRKTILDRKKKGAKQESPPISGLKAVKS